MTRAPTSFGVVVVGRGRVGRAVAAALSEAGLRCTSISGRGVAAGRSSPALAAADVVWLCVPDSSLAAASAGLASRSELSPATVVLHAAGARGLDALSGLEHHAVTGALHPLVSFAEPGRAPRLAGATFVVQGPPRAVRAARVLARACGARLVVAPPTLDRALYHAAAALLANGSAALAATSLGLLVAAGLPAPASTRALGGLLASVAHNVGALGPERALTGPIVRGDVATVSAHLSRLDTSAPSAARVYRDVGRAILEVARGRGLAAAELRALETLLAHESAASTRSPFAPRRIVRAPRPVRPRG